MPTQKEIAEHLDMSERHVRDVLKSHGIDWTTSTLDHIRITYIRDLREKAAGRGGDAQQSLTAARTAEANASTELKLMMIAEKAGLLVPVEEIEPLLLAMVTAARTELLALPNKLVAEIKALTGAEVDAALIEERIHESLNHLATSLQQLDAGDDDESGEIVAAASEADDD